MIRQIAARNCTKPGARAGLENSQVQITQRLETSFSYKDAREGCALEIGPL